MKKAIIPLLVAAVILGAVPHALPAQPEAADPLARGFAQPPDTARPWVYWFWMDGNLSREGITADLEAMKRAGLGGVIIMEVNVGIPQGPVKFMGPEWRELFKHVAAEAARLGLEIDLNASPGWTGSGGPWIKPEQSMQTVVFSETNLVGGQRFDGRLPQPPVKEGFYREIAVLAFPMPERAYRIADIQEKTLTQRGHYSSERGVRSSLPAPAEHFAVPPDQAVSLDRLVDLTPKLQDGGRLTWDVPQGRWTVLRFGRTSTGANTRPAPAPGLGLECDKLDPAALDAHWQGFIAKLMGDIGPLTGKSLVSLHIDSWEMGPQNWSASFREEFQRRRGYDPLRYLPAMTGRVVESLEVSERFLWDLRQTVQDLIIDNHARHLRALAQRNGMRLSIEPYDGTPCDDLTLGAVADVPMCEFWGDTFSTFFSCTEATSIAHVYGRRIVAAEAFTSADRERWQAHPASMKTLGDWAFCAGVNRFVFHRYQHQPWLDRRPGMTMGPYGVHYERTQTWWDMAPAYHTYLSRCGFLLQQGLAVADICYLSPEGAPNVFRPPASATRGSPPDRLGYNFDGCTPEALLTRMSAKDGRLVLPDGMSYRVLVLPERDTMTPPVLRKIKELADSGATVLGPKPVKSPSLSGFPQCDSEVRQLAGELWGNCDGKSVTERAFGRGRVAWVRKSDAGSSAAVEARSALQQAKWIWHKEGNPAARAPVGRRYFRRAFTVPSDSAIESARMFMTADNGFALVVNGQQAGSGDNFKEVYVLDVGPSLKTGSNLLAVMAVNGGDAPNPAGLIGSLIIKFKNGTVLEVPTDRYWESASGPDWKAAKELGPAGMAPWADSFVRPSASEEYGEFPIVAGLLQRMGVPPDFESDVKLRYTHRRDGAVDIYFVANPEERPVAAICTFRASGRQPELWDAVNGEIRRLSEFTVKDWRTLVPLRFDPGQSYFVMFRLPLPGTAVAGRNFPEAATVAELSGAWEVSFDPKWGGPEKVTFPTLADWGQRPEAGIKFYSGTATYRKAFDLTGATRGSRHYLDLGVVRNMARVRLNGRDLGVAWCAPWRVEITGGLKARDNRLEITVANLWPNRLIGDEQLPPDCEFGAGGELVRWPDWLLKNQPRPSLGRYTFTTWRHFSKDSRLLPSGLLGPVTVLQLGAE
jgi:hypothetical protein